MKYSVITTFLLFLIAFQSLAQQQPDLNLDVDAIDKYLQEQMVKKQVPGVFYVIVKEGKVMALNTFGVTSKGEEKVTASTPFGAIFISYTFLAISILQLEEKGLLKLDDPVVKHIPWFTLKDTEQSNKITIRHLLNNQSGIGVLDGKRHMGVVDASPDAMENMVREMSSYELEAEPGTTKTSSNAVYSILALLLEKISGQLHEDYYQQHIFAPLGMTESFVNNINPKANKRAFFHSYWFGQIRRISDSEPDRRAAIVYLSANDAAKYVNALLQKDEQLLSSASYETIFNTKDKQGISAGYGWSRFGDTHSNFRSWGGGLKTTCAISLFTEQETGIAVFANAASGFGWVKPDELVYGPTYIIEGKPPPNWSSTFEIIIFIIAGLIPLIFLFLNVKLVHRKLGKRTMKRPSQLNIWLSLAGSLLLAWFLIYFLPTVAGGKPLPIDAVLLYAPDAGWILILGATFALIWALLRLVFYYFTNNMKKSKGGNFGNSASLNQ